ncbi:MAG: hypothetical protein RMN53_08065 [Anaerolineae bacterium]|nr:hypothetical protein [Anaerolineae bacterium]
MNVTPLKQQVLEKRAWLQSVADHTVEQATMDPQSNYAFRMAQEKLAAIERTLHRMDIGTFGRCDQCGGAIEAERLEFLLDQERHLCAQCANALSARRTYAVGQRSHRPARGRLSLALATA